MDRAYVIAALPRTGSFRLCELLAETGVAGYPQEYGDINDRATWHEYHGFSHHVAYFHAFFRFCRTPNGVFGAKLMWSQFAALRLDIRSYLRIDGAGLGPLASVAGPVSMIFLQREDRLAQAISLYRAMATGAWSSRAAAPLGQPPYDRGAIRAALDMIEADIARWEQFFSDHHIVPCRLRYEDIATDPLAVLARVLHHLRLPLPAGARPDSALRPQADEQTQLWRERYLLEAGRPDAMPAATPRSP
jgi:LPS sulfotransferase NodH